MFVVNARMRVALVSGKREVEPDDLLRAKSELHRQ